MHDRWFRAQEFWVMLFQINSIGVTLIWADFTSMIIRKMLLSGSDSPHAYLDWFICLSIIGMRAFHWHLRYSLFSWNVYQWSLAGLDAHSAPLGLAEAFTTFLNLIEGVAQVKAHHHLLDRLLLVWYHVTSPSAQIRPTWDLWSYLRKAIVCCPYVACWVKQRYLISAHMTQFLPYHLTPLLLVVASALVRFNQYWD